VFISVDQCSFYLLVSDVTLSGGFWHVFNTADER
jgi:hypothetical protein